MIKSNPKQAEGLSEPKLPPDLQKALAAAPIANAQWRDLTLIARMDFIRWIVSAKQPETRRRRIEVTCSKLTAGERRPCCYNIVPMDLYKALAAAPRAKAQWSSLTPIARRDFVSWIDLANESKAQKLRIKEACMKLAAGKQRP